MPITAEPKSKATGNQRAKVASLLKRWMTREAEYDAKTWARAKRAIETNRLSNRKRFHD
jgi:hypothetical protein